MTNSAVYFNSQLPWVSSKSENKTFFQITVCVLIATLVFAFYVMLSEVPEIPRAEQERIPPQLAKIILAQKPLPPPPVVEVKPEPEIFEPENTLEKVDEAPSVPEPVVEKPVSKPKPPVVEPSEQEKLAKARETAQSKGVLKFADQLANMRQQANLSNLANTKLSQGGGQAEQTARNVIAAPSLTGSGGIQTSALSTNVGAAGELEGRRNTEFVAASQGEAALATKRLAAQQQVIGSRDLDQIRQILDANKGAVYSLYRRALRSDPSIEGKLTVKLIIEANGTLSLVELIDSELGAPELVAKLISRIGLIDFGSAQVTRTELEYAYNFLPF